MVKHQNVGIIESRPAALFRKGRIFLRLTLFKAGGGYQRDRTGFVTRIWLVSGVGR